jgi:ribosome-associated protein
MMSAALSKPAPSLSKMELAQAKAREFAIEAARLVSDDKCTDVVVVDVRGLSAVSDFLVIGSGTSDRQMRSVLHHVAELGNGRGFHMVRSSKDDRATWLLADFVDVVVHLFEPNTRAHYDLETMWGDAPRLTWERTEPPKAPGTAGRQTAATSA